LPYAQKLEKCGLNIYATEGTSEFLSKNNIKNQIIKKLQEGRPNIVDSIKNNELQLIINTPIGKNSKYDDSYIRMMAIQRKIPYVTSMAAAQATVDGIEAMQKGKLIPKALQEYHEAFKKEMV